MSSIDTYSGNKLCFVGSYDTWSKQQRMRCMFLHLIYICAPEPDTWNVVLYLIYMRIFTPFEPVFHAKTGNFRHNIDNNSITISEIQ